MKKKKPISELKKLMNKVRKLPEYLNWKKKILLRSFPDGKIPKGMQVHHSLHNFSWYFETWKIKSVKEAIKCEHLWSAPGVCLTRGEHFLLSRISFYKYPTEGFVLLLAEELERLQIAQYDERPERKHGKANR